MAQPLVAALLLLLLSCNCCTHAAAARPVSTAGGWTSSPKRKFLFIIVKHPFYLMIYAILLSGLFSSQSSAFAGVRHPLQRNRHFLSHWDPYPRREALKKAFADAFTSTAAPADIFPVAMNPDNAAATIQHRMLQQEPSLQAQRGAGRIKNHAVLCCTPMFA